MRNWSEKAKTRVWLQREQRIKRIPGKGNKDKRKFAFLKLMSEKIRIAYSRCR